MKHFNQFTAIGGRGKEVKTGGTDSNQWASFSIVTEENWKDKSGEWQTRKTWHNCMTRGYNIGLIEKSEPGQEIFIQGMYKKSEKTESMFVDVRELKVMPKGEKSEAATTSSDSDETDIPF